MGPDQANRQTKVMLLRLLIVGVIGGIILLLRARRPHGRAVGITPAEPVDIYLFWAPGCSTCDAQKPLLDGLQKETRNRIVVHFVNAVEDTAMAARYSIRTVPTTVIVANGIVMDTFHGQISLKMLRTRLNIPC